MVTQMYRKQPCIRVNDNGSNDIVHEVIEEIPLALFVNGRHVMTALISPVDLEDFVTGFLFTEQIIKNADDIESIKVEENRVSVITKNLFTRPGPKKTILSGCGGSVSYIDTAKLPTIRSEFSVTRENIIDTIKDALNSELLTLTRGIHIIALADTENIIALSEDIGRHNALDRVIGYGLRNGIDLSRTCAITSGRISSEMVRKCLFANIPIIVSTGATTTLAVDIADKTRLTLIGFVTGKTMHIYTNPDRIKGLQ